MLDLNNYAVVDYTLEKYFDYCSNFTFELQKNRERIHPPGFYDCFLKRKNKIIFMHIDKCASSTMRSVLKSSNFCDMSHRVKNVEKIKKYFIKNNYRFYSIIRNPRDRYISGLQEFIKRYRPNKEFIISNLQNNKFIFDEHTSPQNCFLFLCEDKCNYLKLDKNISEKVSNVINLNVKLPTKNPSLKNIKSICEELFEIYCKDNINFYDLYKKDYEVYNTSL